MGAGGRAAMAKIRAAAWMCMAALSLPAASVGLVRPEDTSDSPSTVSEFDNLGPQWSWVRSPKLREALAIQINGANFAKAKFDYGVRPRNIQNYYSTHSSRRVGTGTGSGSSSPTYAPTTAPTGPTYAPTSAPTSFAESGTAGETVTQAVSFTNIADASTYNSDTTMQAAYEDAYGLALGLVTCSGGSCTYCSGCSVASSAARRRDATVTFVAGVPTSSSASLTSTAATSSTMVSSLSTVTGTVSSYSSVSTPSSSSDVSAGASTVTYYSDTSAGSGDDNLTYVIVGAVLGAVVVAGVIVAVLLFVKFQSGPKGALGGPLVDQHSEVELHYNHGVGIDGEGGPSTPVHTAPQRV